MPLQALIPDRPQRPPIRSSGRNKGPLQLGWPHFWLLGGVLGGILGLIFFVFYLHISSL